LRGDATDEQIAELIRAALPASRPGTASVPPTSSNPPGDVGDRRLDLEDGPGGRR